MTKETLEKANDLANKLEECKKNLQKIVNHHVKFQTLLQVVFTHLVYKVV